MKGDDAGWLALHIEAQAEESALEHMRQGWEAHSGAYDIAVYYGDADALEERIGRKPTHYEVMALETAIRRELRARTGE